MPFGAFAPLPLRLGGSAVEGWPPEQHARFCADLVAVKRVAPLARLTVTQSAPTTATITAYRGQNGSGLAYAPTIVAAADGDTTITFPAYWTDEFEVQHPLKVRVCVPSATSTAAKFITYTLTGRALRVLCRTAAGVLTSCDYSLRVW